MNTMNKKGFTLVEMLIVIVIIGILAAALIPRLTGIQARARDVARGADLQQLTQSIAMYALDRNGRYPGGTGGIWEVVPTTLGEYLKSTPKEAQGTKSAYGYASNGRFAAVAATHEAGKGNWGKTADTTAATIYTAITNPTTDTPTAVNTQAAGFASNGSGQIIVQ